MATDVTQRPPKAELIEAGFEFVLELITAKTIASSVGDNPE